MAGPRITIDGIVTMADGEVLVDREAENAGPGRVWRALQLAWQHIDDPDLLHAWLGGVGPLATDQDLTLEACLALLRGQYIRLHRFVTLAGGLSRCHQDLTADNA